MASEARRLRWFASAAMFLLLNLSLTPLAAAQPLPGDSDAPPDSPCTGDPTADYNGTCGPSLSVPAWSDAAGWNGPRAETITLFDLDKDGKDELIGQGPHGLLVNRWSIAWGQWVPASDLNDPLPFPDGSYVNGSMRFGPLTESKQGVVAIASDGSGLVTWSWNAGDGTAGSGSWTLENQNGPFKNSDQTGLWTTSPAYFETIQFLPEPLPGAGYGLIARAISGIMLCLWDDGSASWACHLATSAFNDQAITDPFEVFYNPPLQYPDNLAEFFWDTIQLGDIYSSNDGPELFGLDADSGSLQVYTWNATSKTFDLLQPGGNAPFWSPQGQWWDVKYSSTIQTVQLLGAGQARQVIGRSQNGLEWHSLDDTGCGGHAPPCWKDLTNRATTYFSDYAGFAQPQYYRTIRFIDLDGDGIDEVLARDPGPQGSVLTWSLHANAGWTPIQVSGQVSLAAGPADDPLWSNPTYYEMLAVGVVSDDGRGTLIARGKYGVRTWQYWDNSGWWRPYQYGFLPFSSQGQTNAYALLNEYLSLVDGQTVRDSYTANNTDLLDTYISCLTTSTAPNTVMPPSETCAEIPPPTTLANPNGVTAADWQAVTTQLLVELELAKTVSGHFNENIAGILNQLYLADESNLNVAMSQIFPDGTPSGGNVSARLGVLFLNLAASFGVLAGPEVNAGLHVLATVVGAMQSMQTPQNSLNLFDLTYDQIQGQVATSANEALGRNTDLFQYVVQDQGLLYLYGALIDDQYWAIEAAQTNAAISAGQYTNATWLYQTLLPLDWQVWVCNDDVSVGTAPCDGIGLEEGTNGIWIGGPWKALIGELGTLEAIDPTDATFLRVFGDIASNCAVGGTVAGENWTYAGCNLGVSINTVLWWDGAWTTFTCTVNDGESAQPCGGVNSPVDPYYPPIPYPPSD